MNIWGLEKKIKEKNKKIKLEMAKRRNKISWKKIDSMKTSIRRLKDEIAEIRKSRAGKNGRKK